MRPILSYAIIIVLGALWLAEGLSGENSVGAQQPPRLLPCCSKFAGR